MIVNGIVGSTVYPTPDIEYLETLLGDITSGSGGYSIIEAGFDLRPTETQYNSLNIGNLSAYSTLMIAVKYMNRYSTPITQRIYQSGTVNSNEWFAFNYNKNTGSMDASIRNIGTPYLQITSGITPFQPGVAHNLIFEMNSTGIIVNGVAHNTTSGGPTPPFLIDSVNQINSPGATYGSDCVYYWRLYTNNSVTAQQRADLLSYTNIVFP